jgi:hypothetical protein
LSTNRLRSDGLDVIRVRTDVIDEDHTTPPGVLADRWDRSLSKPLK